MKLIQFSDPDRLFDYAADRFVHLAARSLRDRGRFVVLLSGGTTPYPLYRRLAGPPWTEAIDWTNVHVGWADERCVPLSDPASNASAAIEAWLAHVPIPSEQILPIRGDADPPAEAAAYTRRLRSVLGEDGAVDLTLLGIGADGHTASLFPKAPSLNELQPSFVAVHRPEDSPPWRISATLPLLNASREIIFLVTGAEKAAALAAVRAGAALPATQASSSSGTVIWLADTPACVRNR